MGEAEGTPNLRKVLLQLDRLAFGTRQEPRFIGQEAWFRLQKLELLALLGAEQDRPRLA
jgi:hypothetical protein